MIAAPLAAVTVAAPPPGYAVVKRLELSGPLGLKDPWVATIQAPTGQDAPTGDKPLRVCFTGGRDGRTECEPVVHEGHGFQTLLDAKVETLSKARGVRALVVRAAYSAGGDGLAVTTVWAYFKSSGFLQTFASAASDVGEGAFLSSGPLAGDYVSADFVELRPSETRWGDPHRFSISVYKPTRSYDGYLQVLQYVTSHSYPAEREAAHPIVDAETPRIVQILHHVYPQGAPP